MKSGPDFAPLEEFLVKVPGMSPKFGHGADPDGRWWLKMAIDIDHPMSWRVVQELGHVLNYLSVADRLPTAFKPVSPPPYMNGGPKDFLSWVIECSEPTLSPTALAEVLEGHLPHPVVELNQWTVD